MGEWVIGRVRTSDDLLGLGKIGWISLAINATHFVASTHTLPAQTRHDMEVELLSMEHESIDGDNW